jgi:hypothetical protein
VGLPIPQIVLAESKDDRGKFIVLDGKQRLLSILQFWGLADGPNNAYALSSLTLRPDLKRRTFSDLSREPELRADFDSLCNQAIRTVVLRNWRDTDFLHTVFLRLNTGSVALSPQELRQALIPGEFTDYIDDAAARSPALRMLLAASGPDPRMRDIEILARFMAFRFFATDYPGRMKEFLDDTFERFNDGWEQYKARVTAAASEFERGVETLVEAFGDDVARKPGSRQFNRAIFDVLIYFHAQEKIRKGVAAKKKRVRSAFENLLASDSDFVSAIESDTAGAPNTATRFKLWAERLGKVAGFPVSAPKIPLKRPRPSQAGRRAK